MKSEKEKLSDKLWRIKNKDKIAAYAREYARKNRDILNMYAMFLYWVDRENRIARQSKWNKENKHKINKYRRIRYVINPMVREHNKEYRAKNPEKWINLSRDYYIKNKVHHLQIVRKYHAKHPELIRRINREWYHRHRFEIACYNQLLDLSKKD